MLCAAAWAWDVGESSATEVLMKDGRVLTGKLGLTTGLADMNQLEPNPNKDKAIVFLDDDLRRTFISKQQIKEIRPDTTGQVPEKFRVRQGANRTGPRVVTVGPFIHVTPFDAYGRRTITMSTGRGPVNIVQGITEITPEWTKVEGLTYMWDMRIATSSIPRDVLHTILMKQIKDPKDIDQHKKVAHFYLQCGEFDYAMQELEATIAAFPNDTQVQQELAPSIKAMRKFYAESLLRELKMRRDAGQHEFVLRLLKKFPSDDVPGETLQAVREMIQEDEALQARRNKVIEQIDALLAKIKDPGTDAPSVRCGGRLRRSWATTRSIAWRAFCKASTTRPGRPRTSWPWPSAAGSWDRPRPRPS